METPMDKCNHCGKDYALSSENAALNLFIRLPSHNFAQAQCPHCEGWTRIFLTEDSVCALLDSLQLLVFVEPSADLKAAYIRVFGKPKSNPIPDIIASEYEIPPNLEKEIRRLHDALNDPNFSDEMELPQPPSKLPPRWRGDDNRPGASA